MLRARCTEAMRPVLERVGLEVLEAHPASVYALSPELRLSYVNPAWEGFALANGGAPVLQDWPLGRDVMAAVPQVLRPFYYGLFHEALQGLPQHPLQHAYECSSADVYRRFAMTLYPLEGQAGLLVVNALALEQAHAGRSAQAPEEQAYRAAGGLITQCAHCRMIRHGREPGRWDWVPAWVRQPPREVSHGICDVCLAQYYPPLEDEAG